MISEAQFADEYTKSYQRTLLMVRHRFRFAPHVCEDVVQGAWARAWERRSQFRGESAFRTWIFMIVLNAARQEIRDLHRRGEVPELPVIPVERDLDTELTVRKVLSRSHHRDRLYVTLQYVEGLSMEEIAAKVGCPTAAAKSNLFRAKARIRTSLLVAAHAKPPTP